MAEQNESELQLQRIYVKDASLETPGTPVIFKENWQPEVSIDLNIKNEKLEKDVFEIVLSVTVTAKQKEKTIFLVEVHQAGIFQLKGFIGEQEDQVLKSYCPSILFPYAREVISDLVVRASFPQLNLAPINFDALYLQQKQQASKEDEKTKH